MKLLHDCQYKNSQKDGIQCNLYPVLFYTPIVYYIPRELNRESITSPWDCRSLPTTAPLPWIFPQ